MTISRSRFFSILAGIGAGALPAAARCALPPWCPLPPPLPEGKGRALVLSGAGARGAYEAGALKWLFRDVARSGQPFDVICGSSAGAINAAFSALGTANAIQTIEALWKGMPAANIIQLEPSVQDVVDAALQVQEAAKHGFPAELNGLIRARQLLHAAGAPGDILKLGGAVSDVGVRALVQRYPLDITALQTNLFITATNITRMKSDSFYRFVGSDAAANRKSFLARVAPRPRLEAPPGTPALTPQLPLHHELTQQNLVDAIVASTSMPGVFKPVAVQHAESAEAELYVDGGVINNLSVSLAADAGASDITVLLATAPDEMPHNDASLAGVLQESYALVHDQILQDDINLAIAKNLLERDRNSAGLNSTVRAYLQASRQSDWEPLTLRLIRPRAPLDVMTMGFNHQAGIDAAFDAGYADAAQPYIYTMT